ncbi:SMEK domain-containing protein [Pseudomonas sp. IT-P218]|uniref:SMEK domain-containing protein n=1 Tax=Pseudomonas sp. IT-P218 TaxID=3026449 RepID=UPI0039E1CC91
MLSDRLHYMYELTHALGSYANQVQLAAKEGYTDPAKAAEETLIEIVNLAYNCNFINLNASKINHPGIDWLEARYGTGLQVTVTDESSKINDSITKVTRHDVKTSNAIWFLIITTSRHGSSGKHGKYSTSTITMNDIVRQISALPDEEFGKAVKLVKTKLSRYLNGSAVDFLSPKQPRLLSTSPTAFIDFHELWLRLDSRDDVQAAVISQLNSFLESYCFLPAPVRAIVKKIIEFSSAPKNIREPLRVDLTEFFYRLNEKEKSELPDIIEILEKNSHGRLQCSNSRFEDDGVTIISDHHIELDWTVCEPDMNIYAALKSFYLSAFDLSRLSAAFEACHFREL